MVQKIPGISTVLPVCAISQLRFDEKNRQNVLVEKFRVNETVLRYLAVHNFNLTRETVKTLWLQKIVKISLYTYTESDMFLLLLQNQIFILAQNF